MKEAEFFCEMSRSIVKFILEKRLAACGTSGQKVRSSTEGDLSPKAGTLLTLFGQLLESLFPAITHRASSSLLHLPATGTREEDDGDGEEAVNTKYTQIVFWHWMLLKS